MTVEAFVEGNSTLKPYANDLRPLFTTGQGRTALAGDLRPDLVVRGPGQLVVWDLTRYCTDSKHLAKTMLYEAVLNTDGKNAAIAETYYGHMGAAGVADARVAAEYKSAIDAAGAPRRIAQLLAARPDLRIVPIRGNVPPRLARTKGPGGLDAVVLAAAGLRRLGRAGDISELLPVDPFTPSPAQGALGIQIREDDAMLRALLADLGDPEADAQVRAERALLTALRSGCDLSLTARVTAPDGTREVAVTATGPATDPETLGRTVAADLLRHGAGPLLDAAWPVAT
ncbi:hypothetical protein [Streptomyces abikoensis]|uniref:hypothetical protein n=1 Tax=Streptomyces abikoensis TaxID=97398 RepID=UPI00167797AC|nr:hypothetical protein [Streptomyces abikoensis]